MKNKDSLMIVLIIVLLIVLGLCAYFYLFKEHSGLEDNNNITFNKVEYLNIDNVIYYESTTDITDVKETLIEIINQMKNDESYSQHQYLFIRKLATIDEEEIYRMMQIQDGVVIDDTEFNIYYFQDSKMFYAVSLADPGVGPILMNKIKDVSCKIKEKEAKQIVLQYFKDNPKDMNKMISGPWGEKEQNDIQILCKYCLVYYEYKMCWKFEFYIGNSNMIIDANTGEILDTYFHNGVYIDSKIY